MIKKIFIENFKAIHHGTGLDIQPFTVFIGNNGTGKSSIIEALRALQIGVSSDLNSAFEEWGGLEKVRNNNADLTREISGFGIPKSVFEPLKIEITAVVNEKLYDYKVRINLERSYYVVEYEELICDQKKVFTSIKLEGVEEPEVFYYNDNGEQIAFPFIHNSNSLILSFKGSPSYFFKPLSDFSSYIEDWQFLYLNAHIMGVPSVENKLTRIKKLNFDGQNIAEFIFWLKNENLVNFDSLIEKMKFVLPYIDHIDSDLITETKNTEFELKLYESSNLQKSIPSWLLSSGTLRILALLAMFEITDKPSVLFIDEIENGLDPRTIGLLLSQIESVFLDKTMQVIITTHSPFLLDMIPIESVIVSEKSEKGSTYKIPANNSELKNWKNKFSPGKLYTMGKFS